MARPTRTTPSRSTPPATAELAPLLIVGALALIALGLWLVRSSHMTTGAHPNLRLTPMAAIAPQAAPIEVTAAPEPAVPTTLQVPRLPAGVVGATWRHEGGQARLVRPDGSYLELSLEPKVQRTLETKMAASKVPYAGVVLLDPKSGAIRAWAEKREAGDPIGDSHGLLRSTAPAGELLGLATVAGLLEAKVPATTRVCVPSSARGVDSRVLRAGPQDDRCLTLPEVLRLGSAPALGRLALQHLTAGGLVTLAEDLGFGGNLPFDVDVERSRLIVAAGELGLARSAAGLGTATLSPLHAAVIAAALANHGTPMQPSLVQRDSAQPGLAREPMRLAVGIQPPIAAAIGAMLADQPEGSVVHRGLAPWPEEYRGVKIAALTASIDERGDQPKGTTWFLGYAPADNPQIAVAVLAVNQPAWHLRAPTLARTALIAWLEQHPDVIAAANGKPFGDAAPQQATSTTAAPATAPAAKAAQIQAAPAAKAAPNLAAPGDAPAAQVAPKAAKAPTTAPSAKKGGSGSHKE